VPVRKLPRLTLHCHTVKRHGRYSYSCTVLRTASKKLVTRCSARGKVTQTRRDACRAKALKKLGYGTATTASVREDTSFSGILVCSDGAAGASGSISVTAPVMTPRDNSQDEWMAFMNTVQWWDGASWHNWLQSDPIYTWYAADVFNLNWHQILSHPWIDYNISPPYIWNGSWIFNVPRGYWYAVLEGLRFYPQPGNNGQTVWTHAYQNALGSEGMQVCHI
jgi:hypothetical protein